MAPRSPCCATPTALSHRPPPSSRRYRTPAFCIIGHVSVDAPDPGRAGGVRSSAGQDLGLAGHGRGRRCRVHERGKTTVIVARSQTGAVQTTISSYGHAMAVTPPKLSPDLQSRSTVEPPSPPPGRRVVRPDRLGGHPLLLGPGFDRFDCGSARPWVIITFGSWLTGVGLVLGGIVVATLGVRTRLAIAVTGILLILAGAAVFVVVAADHYHLCSS